MSYYSEADIPGSFDGDPQSFHLGKKTGIGSVYDFCDSSAEVSIGPLYPSELFRPVMYDIIENDNYLTLSIVTIA